MSSLSQSLALGSEGWHAGRWSQIEVVVNAGAHSVPTTMIVDVVETNACVPAIFVHIAARKVSVEIFSLRRPVGHEHPLCATAGCPTCLRRGIIVPAYRAAITLRVAISKTSGCVDQQRRHDRHAKAAAHGAKPWDASRLIFAIKNLFDSFCSVNG